MWDGHGESGKEIRERTTADGEVTYSISSDRPVCSIRHPPCAIPPVPAHKTPPQAFCVTLAAFEGEVEALHVFFELRADGHCTRHGAEGEGVGFAPSRRAAVAREGVVSLDVGLMSAPGSGNGV